MASEPSAPRAPASGPRRRWRFVFIIGIAAIIGGSVLLWAWAQWKVQQRLAQAIAEADRLDPGWRLADLMAKRRAVPADTNSANRVLKVAEGIPEAWPKMIVQPEPRERESEDTDVSAAGAIPDANEPVLTATDVEDTIRKTPPNEALSPATRKALELALKPVEGELVAARSLAGTGEGRYELTLGEVAIAQSLPHLDKARKVADLLFLDAARLSDSGKIDEALISARAILGVGRSTGDEPQEYSQLFRLHQRRAAVGAILRALGQGEASDATLAAIQDDLAAELGHDLLLCAMRAQRAAYFDTLGKMADGAYARYAEGDFAPANAPGADEGRAQANPISQLLYMRAYGLHNQALALSILNHSVEGAKFRPFEPGWSQHWRAFEEGLDGGNSIERRLGATAYTILPLNQTMVWMSYESQARFAAMRVLFGG